MTKPHTLAPCGQTTLFASRHVPSLLLALFIHSFTQPRQVSAGLPFYKIQAKHLRSIRTFPKEAE
jgi:hypothetical protein